MAVDVRVEENWTIEPELAEQPPRRFVESGYPDHNKPNAMALYAAGGVAGAGGLILMIVGFARGSIALALLGILLMLGGAFVIAYLVPQLMRKHLARAEHLITSGVPVMARLLSADNMAGDNRDGRRLKYQISLPNGEMVHRDVNADDRVLPKRIPANVTALMDVESSDVELYCALPYRAALKTSHAKTYSDPLTPTTQTQQTPQTAPAGTSGRMGTIAVEAQPEGERPRPRRQEEEAPVKEEKGSGTAGLPWE